jgi:hypothetical protein
VLIVSKTILERAVGRYEVVVVVVVVVVEEVVVVEVVTLITMVLTRIRPQHQS